MSLSNVMHGLWAITPEGFSDIQSFWDLRLKDEKIDIAAVESRLGRPLSNVHSDYTVEREVARLNVNGFMAPKANMLTQISGGVSTRVVTAQLDAMRLDSRVKAAAIVWDSPGGSVLAVPAAAAALMRLAETKPTVSVGEGTLASAAYWVASAANAIYIDGTTDNVGSLGVYQRVSWGQADPNSVEIVRGRYKRASLNGKPPEDDVMADLVQRVDHTYRVMVGDIARHRGVTDDEVLEHMADGRVFIGRQALDAGLVDGIATADAVIEQLATNPRQFATRRRAQIRARGAAITLPPAAPRPSAIATPMTRQQQADAAMRYSIENKVSFVDACHAIGIKA